MCWLCSFWRGSSSTVGPRCDIPHDHTSAQDQAAYFQLVVVSGCKNAPEVLDAQDRLCSCARFEDCQIPIQYAVHVAYKLLHSVPCADVHLSKFSLCLTVLVWKVSSAAVAVQLHVALGLVTAQQ